MKHLKELRNEKNLTQMQVASDLGLSRAAYTNIENNKRQPDNDALSAIADYFEVTVDYLLGRTDEKSPQSGQRMNRIKELRKSANLNQQALANYLNVSRSTVAMWERGTEPGNEMLLSIANYFGVTVDYLLGRTDEKSPQSGQTMPASALSPDEAYLLSVYRSLNQIGRDKLTDFARDLKSSGNYEKDTQTARMA